MKMSCNGCRARLLDDIRLFSIDHQVYILRWAVYHPVFTRVTVVFHRCPRNVLASVMDNSKIIPRSTDNAARIFAGTSARTSVVRIIYQRHTWFLGYPRGYPHIRINGPGPIELECPQNVPQFLAFESQSKKFASCPEWRTKIRVKTQLTVSSFLKLPVKR